MDYSCFHGLVGFDESSFSLLPLIVDDQYLIESSSGLWIDDLAQNLINLNTISIIHKKHGDTLNFIKRMYRGGIASMMGDLKVLRSAKNGARDLLAHQTSVIKGAAPYSHKVSKSGRFVGLGIRTKSKNAIKLLIQRIGFQFDSVQTDLPIYLYSSTDPDPIFTYLLSANKANGVTWVEGKDMNTDVLVRLDNKDSQTYFLGYYEDDLTGFALEKQYSWKSCGCGIDPYQKYSKYFDLQSIAVPADAFEPSQGLFDTKKIGYTSGNYGLNFEPYVSCDLDTIFCDQKDLFASAMQHSIAINVLQEIYSSIEVNQVTMTNIKQMAFGRKEELVKDYKDILSKVNMDFSGLDRECLPAYNGWKVGRLVRNR